MYPAPISTRYQGYPYHLDPVEKFRFVFKVAVSRKKMASRIIRNSGNHSHFMTFIVKTLYKVVDTEIFRPEILRNNEDFHTSKKPCDPEGRVRILRGLIRVVDGFLPKRIHNIMKKLGPHRKVEKMGEMF